MRQRCAVIAITACLAMSGCAYGKDATHDSGRIQAVTSFSILTDMVAEIGGRHVDVHNLVPTGTDPHEYVPKPDDIKRAADADVVMYNGLNLEGGSSGWFAKLMDSVDQDRDRIFVATAGIEPMTLTDHNQRDEYVNPHAFIDPNVGVTMAENIRDALIATDPDHETEYRDNARGYIAKLESLAKEYGRKIDDIPEDRRIIVTSERAYQYLADRYDLQEGYIWAIDTEENGTPEQIKSLITFISDTEVPGLFVESNVDPRPMESVSKETGVPIAGTLYSDEIGTAGSDADTYLAYLQHNIDVIHAVLAG